MATTNTTIRVRYDVSGGIPATFPIPFPYYSVGDIHVILTDAAGVAEELELGLEYDLSAPGSTGTLTRRGDWWPAAFLAIYREHPYVQDSDILDGDKLSAAFIETALDKLTAQTQQLADAQSRSILAPATDPTLTMELPPAASRAGKYLGFGPDGQAAVVSATIPEAFVSPFAETLLADASQLAMLKTLGVVSADASGGLPEASRHALENGVRAQDVAYDPTASGLVATQAQAAIDETEARTDSLEGRATTLEGRATTLEGRATTLEARTTTLENGPYPVGSVYVQLPGELRPDQLFPGTWKYYGQDATLPSLEGLFARSEGGDAKAFELSKTVQTASTTVITFTAVHGLALGDYVRSSTGEWRKVSIVNSTKQITVGTAFGAAPSGDMILGQGHAFMTHLHNRNTSGAAEKYVSGTGTVAWASNGSVGASNTGTTTSGPIANGGSGTPQTASETRPANVTARYWKRTA